MVLIWRMASHVALTACNKVCNVCGAHGFGYALSLPTSHLLLTGGPRGRGRAGLRLRLLSLRRGVGAAWLPFPGEFIDGDRGQPMCEAFSDVTFRTYSHNNWMLLVPNEHISCLHGRMLIFSILLCDHLLTKCHLQVCIRARSPCGTWTRVCFVVWLLFKIVWSRKC